MRIGDNLCPNCSAPYGACDHTGPEAVLKSWSETLFPFPAERWEPEEERKNYLKAYGERWEARIEHDGEDHWMWWVGINDGQYTAEGAVPGALEDEEPVRQCKALVGAVLDQAGAWMKVRT